MRQTIFLLLAGATFVVAQHPNLMQAQTHAEHAFTSAEAPGTPGATPYWTSGDKQGVGTSTTRASHVWFTLGNGALNEVYYPAVDKANTRDLELIVTDGKTFTDVETLDTLHSVVVPDPAALIFTQINTARSGRYGSPRAYVTDPERDALLIRLKLEVLQPGPPLHVWVYYDPSLNNCGLHGTAYSLRQHSGFAYAGQPLAGGRSQCRGNARRRQLGPDGRAGIRCHQQRISRD